MTWKTQPVRARVDGAFRALPVRVWDGSGWIDVQTVPNGADATIEAFADGDLSEYGGTLGKAALVDSPEPPGGSAALALSGDAGAKRPVAASTSGFDRYPKPGDTFRAAVYVPANGEDCYPQLGWAVQAESEDPDCYYLEVDQGYSPELKLLRRSGGSYTGLDAASLSGQLRDRWLTLEVDWGNDGRIDGRLLDAGSELASVGATDSTYADGGIAWRANFPNLGSGAEATTYFANLRLEGGVSGGLRVWTERSVGGSAGENFVFTNATELRTIGKCALAGDEPWASAWRKVKANADAVVDNGLQSVTDDGGGHEFRLDRNDRHDYRTAIRVGDWVRNLALAHFVTGEDRYAEQAIDQIHRWFLDPDSYQAPVGSGRYGVEQYITIPKFLTGAAILRGHPHWGTKGSGTPWNGGSADSAEDALAEWAVEWAGNLKEPNPNNIYVWLQVARAAAHAYAGNDSGFRRAVENYKSRDAWRNYRDPSENLTGAFMSELNRDNGYRYQLYRMKAHVMFCEIARQKGLDLYGFNAPTDSGSGSSLKRSFDFMVPYLKNPGSWRWGMGSRDWDRTHEGPGVYEVAYSHWQEPEYLDVVRIPGRPVDDGRLLEWVTFTHGNRFDL